MTINFSTHFHNLTWYLDECSHWRWTPRLQSRDKVCLPSSLVWWYLSSQEERRRSPSPLTSRYFRYLVFLLEGSSLVKPLVWDSSSSAWINILTSELERFSSATLSPAGPPGLVPSPSLEYSLLSKLTGPEQNFLIDSLCLRLRFEVNWSPTMLNTSVSIGSLTCLDKV